MAQENPLSGPRRIQAELAREARGLCSHRGLTRHSSKSRGNRAGIWKFERDHSPDGRAFAFRRSCSGVCRAPGSSLSASGAVRIIVPNYFVQAYQQGHRHTTFPQLVGMLRRTLPGGTPNIRLNALQNAASDW